MALLALALTMAGAPTQAAVTYTLSIDSTRYPAGFNGVATIELPRYLYQPEPAPSVVRSYFFEPTQLASCSIAQGFVCSGVTLTFLRNYLGEYGIVGEIGSSSVGAYGGSAIFAAGARFDTNGSFAGDWFGFPQAGTLVISGSPDTVPEPAAWAMLIVGFGMAGAAARRQRASSTPDQPPA